MPATDPEVESLRHQAALRNRLSRLLGFVTVVGVLFGATVAMAQELPPGGTFSDDDGNVHEGYIEALVAAGITSGCGEGLFCPDDAVTRGQMAAFLNRAIELPESPGDLFTDDDDSVFENDIERLAEGGVTKGCNPPTNDQFCPDDPVTRGQMAAFLVRAFDYTEDGDTDFTDDDESVFESDIEKLAAAGVTKGCNPPDNTQFCPDDPVSRAEMATFLSRALGLTPTPPPPPVSTTTTTTTPTTSTSTSVPGIPGDSVNCSDFDTWAEAQAWYDTYYPYYGDVANLDADGDGIACESLPGAPG